MPGQEGSSIWHVEPPPPQPGARAKGMATMSADFQFFLGNGENPIFPVSRLEEFFKVCKLTSHNPGQAFRLWLEWQFRNGEWEETCEIVKQQFVAKMSAWLAKNEFGVHRILLQTHSISSLLLRSDTPEAMYGKLPLDSLLSIQTLFGGPHATFFCLLCHQMSSMVVSLNGSVQLYRHPLVLFKGISDGVPKDVFKNLSIAEATLKAACQIPGICDGCSTGLCKLCSTSIYSRIAHRGPVHMDERLIRLYKAERLCLACESASLLSYKPPKPTEESVSEMVKRFRALSS